MDERAFNENRLMQHSLARQLLTSNLTMKNATLAKGVLTLMQLTDSVKDDLTDEILAKLNGETTKQRRLRQLDRLTILFHKHPDCAIDVFNLAMTLLATSEVPFDLLENIYTGMFIDVKEQLHKKALEPEDKEAARGAVQELLADFKYYIEEVGKGVDSILTKEKMRTT